MATLPSTDTPKTDAVVDGADGGINDETPAKLYKKFKGWAEATKHYRRNLILNWSTNIDYRRGKPYASETDEDRVAVPLDWSYTKAKSAALFSQVPQARINHPPQTISPDMGWVHKFEQDTNDTLRAGGIEASMEEVLADVINAAGIGVIQVSREVLTEEVEIPAVDFAMMPPDIAQQIQASGMMPDGSPVPTVRVPREADARYVVARVSPSDFLWPLTFNGSDFDNAPWIGRTGTLTFPEALARGWVTEDEKSRVVSGGNKNILDRLTDDVDKDRVQEDLVEFDEIFYKEFQYNPKATSYNAIHHLVFVTGKDKPVVDEPWQGQKRDEQGKLLGAMRYPIRVLSLSYITDEAIPPSDSAMGRSQVNEINKGRTQMILQRERSMPIRAVNPDRIDPVVLSAMMRGHWQTFVPIQGNPQNAIAEVSRAQMPVENFTFDKIAKDDLASIWQVGQFDAGSEVETKGEANIIQSNMQTRTSRERAIVGSFFCSIAEVVGGLLAIHEPPQRFGEGFDPGISKALSYSILADSTVLIDSKQRLKQLVDFVNFTAKSGMLNVEAVLREMATLSGLDPNVVIQKPNPKPPAEPNISLRLTGTEDLINPMIVAMLMKSGQMPDEKMIEQAKQLIETAVTDTPVPLQYMIPGMMPEGGMPPGGAPPGAPPLPPMPPQGMLPPGPGGPPPLRPPVEPPLPPPPDVGAAHPNWSAMDRIKKRVVERE